MDMTFVVSPMEAVVVMATASVTGLKAVVIKAYARIERIATVACPSLAGTSLSAVSPDHTTLGGTALAAA